MHIFILSKFIVGSNFGAVILKFYILQEGSSKYLWCLEPGSQPGKTRYKCRTRKGEEDQCFHFDASFDDFLKMYLFPKRA